MKVQEQKRCSLEMTENTETAEKAAILFYMLTVLAFSALGFKLLERWGGMLSRSFTAMLVEVVAFVLLVLFCCFTPFRLTKPILFTPWPVVRKSLVHGGWWLLGIGTLCLLGRLALAIPYPQINTRPLVDLQLEVKFRWLYLGTAFVQEFLAKCVMQEKMRQLLHNARPSLVIAACSLVFVVLHGGYSDVFMLAAGGLNFVTGWIYEKDRCVWSAVLIHFACGFFPRMFGIY